MRIVKTKRYRQAAAKAKSSTRTMSTRSNVGKKNERKEGNPFLALRAPAALLSAYVRKHGDRAKACAAIRAHMSKVTGVKLEEVAHAE